MTAQITDRFEYKGKEYSLAALSAPIPFAPCQYGLEPHGYSTACYRGFWCEYKIAKGVLALDNFHMYNDEGRYPEFNGVSVSEPKNDWLGLHFYKGVNLLIPYSGKMLLGREFLEEYYIHMGYQRPYAYKELIELEFDAGKLQRTTDCSKIAARLRGEGAYEADRFNPDIARYVNDSFSLDYETKAWWLSSDLDW